MNTSENNHKEAIDRAVMAGWSRYHHDGVTQLWHPPLEECDETEVINEDGLVKLFSNNQQEETQNV